MHSSIPDAVLGIVGLKAVPVSSEHQHVGKELVNSIGPGHTGRHEDKQATLGRRLHGLTHSTETSH